MYVCIGSKQARITETERGEEGKRNIFHTLPIFGQLFFWLACLASRGDMEFQIGMEGKGKV